MKQPNKFDEVFNAPNRLEALLKAVKDAGLKPHPILTKQEEERIEQNKRLQENKSK